MKDSTLPSDRLDLDKEIAPFVSTGQVPKCGNGLHPMTPENTYVSKATGHRRCRACARQTRKWRPRSNPKQSKPVLDAGHVPLCRNGLHQLVSENIYINQRTGHRRCRACVRNRKALRALRKKIEG